MFSIVGKKSTDVCFVLNLYSDLMEESSKYFLESLFDQIKGHGHHCRLYFSENGLYSLVSFWSELESFIAYSNSKVFVNLEHAKLLLPSLKDNSNLTLEFLNNEDFWARLAKESQLKTTRILRI